MNWEPTGIAYFAAGITEEITGQLARIGDLTVLSRTAVERHLNNNYENDVIKSRDLAIFRSGKLRGTGMLVTDYLVNAGGVVYAAHERLIPTPEHLNIPPERLGDRAAVRWALEEAGCERVVLGSLVARDFDAFAARISKERIGRLRPRSSPSPWLRL